ncbi:hypothetical protein [uncultured Ilyobacter sp.]|uniref:hypothetical protein n=1 Tax=uncultured Ilyobacter sp. TaxID=544433 RepID=UPI0029BFD59A|nr:hypothetical protein [uncultured Ilyobacter sp.]
MAICNLCGNWMELKGKWGDGWSEPREEWWICECGQELDINQAYGDSWSIETEEEKED